MQCLQESQCKIISSVWMGTFLYLWELNSSFFLSRILRFSNFLLNYLASEQSFRVSPSQNQWVLRAEILCRLSESLSWSPLIWGPSNYAFSNNPEVQFFCLPIVSRLLLCDQFLCSGVGIGSQGEKVETYGGFISMHFPSFQEFGSSISCCLSYWRIILNSCSFLFYFV